MDFVDAEFVEPFVELVVNSVDEVDAVAEAFEAASGEGNRVSVAVEGDELRVGARLKHGLRVTAHAESAVDEDAAGLTERRGEEFDTAVPEDRSVEFSRVLVEEHDRPAFVPVF